MKNLAALAIASFSGAYVSREPIAGQITVANASQYDAANLSTELTAYLAGQAAPENETFLDLMFPPVEAGRFFQFQKHDDDQFITENDDSDIRPVGAAFKRVEYRGSKVNGNLFNKGLTYRQDHDAIMRRPDGSLPSGWENAIANSLRKRLIRAEILRGIALLNAGATNANVTFDATTNPDGLLRAACRLSLTGKGVRPTHLMIGDVAWQLRQDSYEAAARANHAMASHGAYDEAELARYLGLRTVRREESLYQTKKGAAKTDILASLAYVYGAESDQMMDDPSNIKRCYGMTDEGQRFGVYVDAKRKFTDITVEHYSAFISPITTGIRKLTIS